MGKAAADKAVVVVLAIEVERSARRRCVGSEYAPISSVRSGSGSGVGGWDSPSDHIADNDGMSGGVDATNPGECSMLAAGDGA